MVSFVDDPDGHEYHIDEIVRMEVEARVVTAEILGHSAVSAWVRDALDEVTKKYTRTVWHGKSLVWKSEALDKPSVRTYITDRAPLLKGVDLGVFGVVTRAERKKEGRTEICRVSKYHCEMCRKFAG